MLKNMLAKHCALALFLFVCTSAQAEDKAAVKSPVQASIKKEIVQSSVELKDLDTALGKVKHTNHELYKEATRSHVGLIGGPDESESMPNFDISDSGGIMPTVTEYLPVRKQWVELIVTQMGQLLPLVRQDIQAVIVPEDCKIFVNDLINNLNSSLADIESHYKNLNQQVHIGSFDNSSIINETMAINDDLGTMNKVRKNIWKIIKEKQ